MTVCPTCGKMGQASPDPCMDLWHQPALSHGFIPTVSWQDFANLQSRVVLLELKVEALEGK